MFPQMDAGVTPSPVCLLPSSRSTAPGPVTSLPRYLFAPLPLCPCRCPTLPSYSLLTTVMQLPFTTAARTPCGSPRPPAAVLCAWSLLRSMRPTSRCWATLLQQQAQRSEGWQPLMLLCGGPRLASALPCSTVCSTICSTVCRVSFSHFVHAVGSVVSAVQLRVHMQPTSLSAIHRLRMPPAAAAAAATTTVHGGHTRTHPQHECWHHTTP